MQKGLFSILLRCVSLDHYTVTVVSSLSVHIWSRSLPVS